MHALDKYKRGKEHKKHKTHKKNDLVPLVLLVFLSPVEKCVAIAWYNQSL
jgi:hypothetical protein